MIEEIQDQNQEKIGDNTNQSQSQSQLPEDITYYNYTELLTQLKKILSPLGQISWLEQEDPENTTDVSINIVRNITENGKNIDKQLFKIRVTETDHLVIKK